MARVARDRFYKEIQPGDTVTHEDRQYTVESVGGDDLTNMLIIVPVVKQNEDDGWIEVADWEVDLVT